MGIEFDGRILRNGEARSALPHGREIAVEHRARLRPLGARCGARQGGRPERPLADGERDDDDADEARDDDADHRVREGDTAPRTG